METKRARIFSITVIVETSTIRPYRWLFYGWTVPTTSTARDVNGPGRQATSGTCPSNISGRSRCKNPSRTGSGLEAQQNFVSDMFLGSFLLKMFGNFCGTSHVCDQPSDNPRSHGLTCSLLAQTACSGVASGSSQTYVLSILCLPPAWFLACPQCAFPGRLARERTSNTRRCKSSSGQQPPKMGALMRQRPPLIVFHLLALAHSDNHAVTRARKLAETNNSAALPIVLRDESKLPGKRQKPPGCTQRASALWGSVKSRPKGSYTRVYSTPCHIVYSDSTEASDL